MGRPLTIGLPISSFLPSLGGMEVGLHNIASRLAARGHRPIVMAPAGHVRNLCAIGMQLPYTVQAFPPKILTLNEKAPRIGLRAFSLYFSWAARRFGIDVWHGTMGYPIGVGLAHFARGRDLPILVRCTGQDIQTNVELDYGMRLNPTVDQLVRQWLPRVPMLVAITETVAEEYRMLGVREERILRIPNGVDVERFRNTPRSEELRDKLGIRKETFVFLSVGRNHPKKNFGLLLDSAQILRIKAPSADFVVIIAGKGSRDLVDRVNTLGLNNLVVLHDEIAPPSQQHGLNLPADDLVALYRSSDCFVLPSLVETFGIVLVEAMAAGLPIITTNGPGCRDVVRNGQDGLVVPAGDAEALADSMLRVLHDPALRNDLVRSAQKRAPDFSWDHVVELYLSGYRRVRELLIK